MAAHKGLQSQLAWKGNAVLPPHYYKPELMLGRQRSNSFPNQAPVQPILHPTSPPETSQVSAKGPRGEQRLKKHLLFPFTDREKAPWEVAFSKVREKGVMFYGAQEVSICARTPIVNRARLTSLPFPH